MQCASNLFASLFDWLLFSTKLSAWILWLFFLQVNSIFYWSMQFFFQLLVSHFRCGEPFFLSVSLFFFSQIYRNDFVANEKKITQKIVTICIEMRWNLFHFCYFTLIMCFPFIMLLLLPFIIFISHWTILMHVVVR